jgi:hypothetical protein
MIETPASYIQPSNASPSLSIPTLWVDKDEDCYGARCGFVAAETLAGTVTRWQEWLFVLRGNDIARFVSYDVPAELHEHAQPMIVPPHALDEPIGESCGEVMAMFERHRNDDRWYKYLLELKEQSTLMADYSRQQAIWQDVIKGKSVFGPHYKRPTIAGGYPREFARRQLRDARREKTGKVQL